MRIRSFATAATLALGLSVALTGCGSDDSTTAADPSSTSPDSTDSTGSTDGTDSTDTTDPSGDPEFTATDYTFRLVSKCFCPLLGPVDIVVENDEVTSATIVRGPDKGTAAPDYSWLTISELLALQDDPKVYKVDVTWPDDQDWPSMIAVDHIKRAIDDEITYVIKDVQFDA